MTPPLAHTNYRQLKAHGKPYAGIPFLLECAFTLGLVAFLPRQRVFLADDHLLIATRQGFVESLRRVPLTDIQATRIEKTIGRATAAAALGTVGALGLAATLYFTLDVESQILIPFILVCAFFSGIAAFGAIAALLAGPACKTTLYTSLGPVELTCLSHLNNARAVLTEIESAAFAAQGGAPGNAIDAAPQVAAPPDSHKSPRQERGRLHALLFSLLLLIGLSATVDLFINNPSKNTADAITGATALFVACLALARQRGSELPKSIQDLTVALTIFMVITFYGLNFLFEFYYAISGAETPNSADAVRHPVRMFFVILVLVGGYVGGVLGLLGLSRFKTRT